MSMDRRLRAMQLFEEALDLDADARAEFLDNRCGDHDDREIRQLVESMLEADAGSEGLLDSDADRHLTELSGSKAAKQPDRIGAYRVIEQLGEGGMAVVYRGERSDEDFEQTVALKLIQPSQRREHWETRFLNERQILASLRHPNIAQLIDGGITEDGNPYFAMEFVNGVPITRYCDDERLSVNERIRLLLSICDAVNYAHGKLIVHRDLKPSNILVDRNGRAKLLDFGIAKLLSDDDTSRTKTALRALTPDYAAPEQFAGGEVTTSVDVYALGGLLYELLSGRRPFASASGSALDIERNIREQGAPSFAKNARALSDAEREATASARRTSPRKLERLLRGDLENIAHKALRAEPDRRYSSVEGFAADLQRYLDGLPVRARADTTWYRLQKFSSRHPVGLPLGMAAALGLMLSTGFALHQAEEARTAATLARLEAAKANETKEFISSLFEFSDPDKNLGDQLSARQLLDLGAQRVNEELAGQPLLRAEMLLLLATTYAQLGLYDTALPLANRAAELYAGENQSALHSDALVALARLNRLNGEFAAADELLAEAEELLGVEDGARRSALLIERGETLREQAQFGPAAEAFEAALAMDRARIAAPDDIARDLYRLGTLRYSEGDSEAALALLDEAAQLLSGQNAQKTTQYAAIQHDMGVIQIQRGQLDTARGILEGARQLRRDLLGDNHPDVAASIKELAGIARQHNRNDEAEALYLEALRINEAMLGPDHPETANTLNSLAVFFRGLGDDERAVEYATRALAGATRVYGPQHPTVGLMTINLGSMQRMLGELDAATTRIYAGRDILVGALGENHQLSGVAYNAVAGVHYDRGEYADAESNFRRALEIFEATAGANHPHMVNIIGGLAAVLVAVGETDEAETQFRRASEIAGKVLPADHPNRGIIEFGLAQIAARRGDCAEAREIAARFGPILEAAGQADRPDILASRDAIDGCGQVGTQ